jgi:hypothetical protein
MLLFDITLLHETRKEHARFEGYTEVKIHIELFWVVTPCVFVLEGQSAGNKVFPNVGILPQHYTASQTRRPPQETCMFALPETAT